MYRRFDIRKGPSDASGKWKQVARSGVGHVVSETDGKWNIDVTMRRVGNSIRREVFSVSIRRAVPRHDEFLSGFTSREAALEAARQRVSMVEAVEARAEARRTGNAARSHASPEDS